MQTTQYCLTAVTHRHSFHVLILHFHCLLEFASSYYRSMNTRKTQSKNYPLAASTAIELKNIPNTSRNTPIWRAVYQLTVVRILLVVFFTFLDLIIVLTANVQLLDCFILEFSEKCGIKFTLLVFVLDTWEFFSFLKFWSNFLVLSSELTEQNIFGPIFANSLPTVLPLISLWSIEKVLKCLKEINKQLLFVVSSTDTLSLVLFHPLTATRTVSAPERKCLSTIIICLIKTENCNADSWPVPRCAYDAWQIAILEGGAGVIGGADRIVRCMMS